jgi:hypothetical protein
VKIKVNATRIETMNWTVSPAAPYSHGFVSGAPRRGSGTRRAAESESPFQGGRRFFYCFHPESVVLAGYGGRK